MFEQQIDLLETAIGSSPSKIGSAIFVQFNYVLTVLNNVIL